MSMTLGYPSAQQMPAARDCQTIGASGEVARVDLIAVSLRCSRKPECAARSLDQRGRIEEQLKWFAGASHTFGQRIQRQLLRRAEQSLVRLRSRTPRRCREGMLAMNRMVASKAARER